MSVREVSRLNDPLTPEKEVPEPRRSREMSDGAGGARGPRRRPGRAGLYGAYLQTAARRKQMRSFPDSI